MDSCSLPKPKDFLNTDTGEIINAYDFISSGINYLECLQKWSKKPAQFRLGGGKWWYQNIYLKSKHWQRLRLQRINLANEMCERCGDSQNLDVHHVSYERLGFEQVSDLEVLCRSCHFGQHKD